MSSSVNATPENHNQNAGEGQEDAQCVARVRAGDDAAFDELVQRYQRRAVAVAYRLLGNMHDAADVAQDAFLRAYRKLEKLDDPRRFGAWLMRIVSNLALNFRRSRSRNTAMSTDDVFEGPEEFRSASGALLGGTAEDAAGAQELKEAVGTAIAELPEKQRLALVLFSMEGLPQKEVAAIMDCSVELVKWNVFQARKTLRKRLADQLD